MNPLHNNEVCFILKKTKTGCYRFIRPLCAMYFPICELQVVCCFYVEM